MKIKNEAGLYLEIPVPFKISYFPLGSHASSLFWSFIHRIGYSTKSIYIHLLFKSVSYLLNENSDKKGIIKATKIMK